MTPQYQFNLGQADPSFDKQLVFDYNDIETFKQNILN